MKAAPVVGTLLVFGLTPAFAQSVGDQVSCTGLLSSVEVKPPSRIQFGSRVLGHMGMIWDESGEYRCIIDQDSIERHSQQWRCASGDRCRILGVLAYKQNWMDLIVRNGKRVNVPVFVIL